MEKRTINAMFLLLIAVGGMFITQSITGYYSWDQRSNVCVDDTSCESLETCCFIYEEDYGLCDEVSNCAAIETMSKEEKSQFSNLRVDSPESLKSNFISGNLHVEKPSTKADYSSLGLGLLLVLIAIGLYLSEYVKEHPKKK